MSSEEEKVRVKPYKILFTGKNYVLIDGIFQEKGVGSKFDLQSTSTRLQDMISHMKWFKPDALVYCLSSESKEDIDRIRSMKEYLKPKAVVFAIIGDEHDNLDFQELTNGTMSDLILTRPIRPTAVLNAMIPKIREKESEREHVLDVERRKEEAHRRREEAKIRAAEEYRRELQRKKEAFGLTEHIDEIEDEKAAELMRMRQEEEERKYRDEMRQIEKDEEKYQRDAHMRQGQEEYRRYQKEQELQEKEQQLQEKEQQLQEKEQQLQEEQRRRFEEEQERRYQEELRRREQEEERRSQDDQGGGQDESDRQRQREARRKQREEQEDKMWEGIDSKINDGSSSRFAGNTENEAEKRLDAKIKWDDEPKKAAPKPRTPAPAPAPKPAADDGHRHILVVDDDPRMLKVIRGHLRGEYDVATAINGRLALKFLEKRGTDMILLDYEMPDMKGPEVLVEIRKNPEWARIPVVFLTGISDMDKVQEVLGMKPQGYLLKPVDHDKLRAVIKKYLG